MNFNKPMIDLVREIRRKVPADDKPGIKLANPDLLSDLIPLYHASSNTVLKVLIRELFNMAGDPWPETLAEREAPKQRFITKVYRGQREVVAADTGGDEAPKKSRPKRIYRGQVVKDF
ncbi:MAG: hypothetical protein ACR2PT_21470 [Endozoicomonas sp.]